ncbi:MAG: hypothetical protein QG610_1502 [Euryarchaeota archaeon]|nr:hypothetical protein [Euryarchaeota archaeon]
MNLRVFIICVAATMLLTIPALAVSTATIGGGVYSWDTFEPLENSVVEVNSTPSQSMLARYGVYSFKLEPGDYLITASYYQNSTLIYSAEESIEVKGEGSYVVDLLLFPVYSEEFMTSENAVNTEISSNITQSASNNSTAVNNSYVNDSSANVNVTENREINGGFTSSTVYYFLAALILLLFIAGYSLKKRRDTEKNKPENIRLEKNRSGIDHLEKSKLLEEKEEYEPKRFSVPASTSGSSAKPVLAKELDKAKLRIEQELPVKPIEIQLSEESEFQAEKEKQAENKEGQFISKIQPAALEQQAKEDKETFAEEISSEEADLEEISLKEPGQEPEPAKMSEPETPVVKKNLPLPTDLQEIMDIIRGQGGRITQKDLRSKLKYSEGKVSLMLADLERRELIEKFKRGRGNIVILRDEKR